MVKLFRGRGRLASCLTLMLLASVLCGQVLAQPKIVNCDALVQSRKRGIAATSSSPLSADDFRLWHRGFRGITIGVLLRCPSLLM